MDLKNIIGHQKQLDFLKENLESGNLAHAYLFAGPADIGKFTIAKIFVKMIQTFELSEEESYSLAVQIDKEINLDTIFLKKAEDDSIKIEQIRAVLSNLQMSGNSRNRVLVIEEIERLTPEAANAMLKMIEEPPGKVIYIFTSSKPELVLETILSRVRRIDFGLLSDEEVLRSLTNRFRLQSKEQLERVTVLAMGRIAKALRLIENTEILDIYEKYYLEIKEFLKNRHIAQGFSFIAQIHNDKLLTEIFIDLAFTILREDLLNSVKVGDQDLQQKIIKNIESLLELKKLSQTNVNSRLMLENFILSI